MTIKTCKNDFQEMRQQNSDIPHSMQANCVQLMYILSQSCITAYFGNKIWTH